jgi:hypothetical protein
MSRRASRTNRQTGAANVSEQDDKPTQPAAVAEGRRTSIDPASAQAIADASRASGFPPPPQVQAVLEGAAPSAAPAATDQEA